MDMYKSILDGVVPHWPDDVVSFEKDLISDLLQGDPGQRAEIGASIRDQNYFLVGISSSLL